MNGKGVVAMSTSIRDIALTKTPTTRNICIPAEFVKKMGIKDDKKVRATYNEETETLTIQKIKD